MTWYRLVQGIAIASLIIVFSEAVLSCTLIEGVSSKQVESEHLATIRAYHLPAVLLACGTLVLYLLRGYRGLVILLLAVAALAISPGWRESSAAIAPDCEPIGGFGVKVVLIVEAVCFTACLIWWLVERRRAKSQSS